MNIKREMELFDEWIIDYFRHVHDMNDDELDDIILKGDYGGYHYERTNDLWETWKARAELGELK